MRTISALILCVAFSMSELASAFPTAGGIYYWASKLGGPKWGWFTGPDPNAGRKRLKTLKWALTGFFLVLGLASLAAYIKIGIEHAPHAGERYTPAALQPAPR